MRLGTRDAVLAEQHDEWRTAPATCPRNSWPPPTRTTLPTTFINPATRRVSQPYPTLADLTPAADDGTQPDTALTGVTLSTLSWHRPRSVRP